MPLKHPTETFLVFLLAIAIALTGLLLSTLPSLPSGMLPWVALFAVTIIYPLGLTPLFRRNRADYPFRWLHWFPALMTLGWFVSQLISQSRGFDQATSVYTWAWTLVPVALGILLIALFCLSVIRRRWPRLALLALVLVPFAAFAVVSHSGPRWDREIAAILWDAQWWEEIGKSLTGTGSRMQAALNGTGKNLDVSKDPSEEAWRERLRVFERRRERISDRLERASEKGTEIAADITMDEKDLQKSSDDKKEMVKGMETGTGMEYREAETQPTRLPQSGMELGFMGMLMASLYAGTVHRRAAKRA
jgi:hypothetical protein